MKKAAESRVRLIDFHKHRTAAMVIRPRIETYKSQYPVQLKKAADALCIGDKDLAGLARILDDEPRHKWPDLLGRLAGQLRLKDADGKAMAQKIDRIDWFRKQMLIDI